MSQRVLCKFFANGACLKGEHCEYSHDWKAPPNNICTFYQKGLCAYGSRCRYEHVKALRTQSSGSSSATSSLHARFSESPSSNGITFVPGAHSEVFTSKEPIWKPVGEQCDSEEFGDVGEHRSVVKAEDRAMCSFAAAGECPRGDKCPHIHGHLCSICGKNCLHPFRPDEREEHLKMCQKKHQQLEALKHSQEIECCVCLERVLSKPALAERKFGLLSECDHPFCISCIRNWRSSSPTSGLDINSALRACPICRKLSYFVVPSVIWYSTKEEKQEIVDSYKSRLKSIDCKHFDFGDGNCPFGTSCFYKHTVRRGSYVWKYHRPPPRRPTSRRSNDVTGFDDFIDTVQYMEDYGFEGLDSDDIEELSSLQMEFLVSLMGLDDSSDSGSDEESIF